MGYTNYWIRTEKPITQGFVDAVKSIVSEANKMGISIRDGYGENKPIVTLDEVNFNGNAEKGLDHENFLLTNAESKKGFNFCKTEEKPYDWVVKKVLAAAKEEELVKDVSDDGEVKRETDATYLGVGVDTINNGIVINNDKFNLDHFIILVDAMDILDKAILQDDDFLNLIKRYAYLYGLSVEMLKDAVLLSVNIDKTIMQK